MNIQKIQVNKGFTLVELIVVITILVILGTIAFLNLGGFSSSARDSQRTSDLNQISQQIMNTQAKNGIIYISMVASGSNNLTAPSIAGGSGVVGTNYLAGDVSYSALGIDSTKFKDPSSGTPYKMGATTLDGGVYEVAASLEEVKKALVIGTFIQRKASVVTGTGIAINGVITLSGAVNNVFGVFKVGDTIALGSTTATGLITGISSDLKTITTNSGSYTNSTPYAYALKADEVAGLIGTGGTNSVTNGNLTNLPY